MGIVVNVLEKGTRQIKTISLEEYEKNPEKYAGEDYDPGFKVFCLVMGILILSGCVLGFILG